MRYLNKICILYSMILKQYIFAYLFWHARSPQLPLWTKSAICWGKYAPVLRSEASLLKLIIMCDHCSYCSYGRLTRRHKQRPFKAQPWLSLQLKSELYTNACIFYADETEKLLSLLRVWIKKFEGLRSDGF